MSGVAFGGPAMVEPWRVPQIRNFQRESAYCYTVAMGYYAAGEYERAIDLQEVAARYSAIARTEYLRATGV